jgi:heme/copper-type cytochrome/quinol oxidase subunit 4
MNPNTSTAAGAKAVRSGLVLVSFAFAVVLTLYVLRAVFAEFLSMRVKVGNIAIFAAAVLAAHDLFPNRDVRFKRCDKVVDGSGCSKP